MAKSKQRRIHITAVGSPASKEVKRLTSDGVKGLVRLAQGGAGERYKVTANERMILAKEVDEKGGRFDDAARAREVETLLADDNVAALVTIRGGAWFVRILERINFDVLRRRRRPIYIFGFSEMTVLVAIAGQYPKAIGLYDLGPGFLYAGMKSDVQKNAKKLAASLDLPPEQHPGFAAGYALAKFPQTFADFFGEVADVLDGKDSPRVPTGRLLTGSLPASKKIKITGGNLSLIVPMLASRYAKAFDTKGKWLAIEDVNEAADCADRMIAGLKLAGLLDRAEGIILGNFHDGDKELSAAMFDILKFHLPTKRRIPVVAIENLGHIYPIAPLPMHREVTMRCGAAGRGKKRVTIEIPWQKWAK